MTVSHSPKEYRRRHIALLDNDEYEGTKKRYAVHNGILSQRRTDRLTEEAKTRVPFLP